MNTKIQNFLTSIDLASIEESRKEILQELVDFIQKKYTKGDDIHLNFICTHNSRRSQFSQIWAQTIASYYNIPSFCYSGGVEVTAFNERAVDSMKRFGFVIEKEREENPIYSLTYNENHKPIVAFSKVYDDKSNAQKEFAAIMTCDHADENCPFIPGAEARIPIRYNDPKAFDDTPLESEKYDERSREIATELFYVFGQIQK